MGHLQSLPDEQRPGGTNYRLPYALLRTSNHASEILRFNCAAVQLAKLQDKERVNLFWDTQSFLVGVFRGGHQRSVKLHGPGRRKWGAVHITSLVRLYEIPYHRHPLPVSQDPDGNVWVDFSGEIAQTKYLPHTVRQQDPNYSFTEKRVARLIAKLSDGSQISNKSWPTLVTLLKEVARAENASSFSVWVDNVLMAYVQDHYPHLWEAYTSLRESRKC